MFLRGGYSQPRPGVVRSIVRIDTFAIESTSVARERYQARLLTLVDQAQARRGVFEVFQFHEDIL